MKKNIISIIGTAVAIFIFLSSSGQQGYEPAGTLYKDNSVTVQLQYRLNDPCTATGNGKKSRYRLFITGIPVKYDKYLNWEMDYYNCDNSITNQSCHYNIGNFPIEGIIEDIDWSFDGYKLDKAFFNVRTSVTPIFKSSSRRPIPVSTAPNSINGSNSISYGEETTLSLNGGTLGVLAEWKWYSDKCGSQLIGTGESITVDPKDDIEYFVRAESPTDTTRCVSFRVSVNPDSYPADRVEGRTTICAGEKNILLSVSGGQLGKNASWTWYQNNLGNAIGKGNTLLVSPDTTTTFFVRAEGTTNITEARNIRISVIREALKDPVSVSGKSFVCNGSALELKVSAEPLPPTAAWQWYKNTVTPANKVATGVSVNVSPSTDATYYVRGEGVCSMTGLKEHIVKVGLLSQAAYNISSSQDPKNKRRTILTVTGGSLGKEAEWNWHKDECDGKKAGTGSSISARVNKTTLFYVNAKGVCNTTGCVSQTVYPRTITKYVFFNAGIVAGQNPSTITERPVVSLTIGKLAKTGWYLRGKFSLQSITTTQTITDNSLPSSSDNYYVFNGNTAENRWAITGGLIKKLNRNFYLAAGVGYGERELAWGLNEYSNLDNNFVKESWGKHTAASYSGAELEAGLVIRFAFFNLMIGANGIVPSEKKYETNGASSKIYIDGYAGFGFAF